MDAATAARFAAGSGMDPAALKDAAATLAAVAVMLWAAWVSQGLYGQWRNDRIDALELASGTVRAVVLALLVAYFIQ